MSKNKILIVEDEETIRKVCQRLLTKFGYEVFAVESVKEGKKKIEATEMDLLVSDLKLPDGSGIDMIRHFKQRFPNKNALVMTGSLTPESRLEQVGSLGILECIAKPFDLDVLVSAVRNGLKA